MDLFECQNLHGGSGQHANTKIPSGKCNHPECGEAYIEQLESERDKLKQVIERIKKRVLNPAVDATELRQSIFDDIQKAISND